jgi:hypothetical protein
VRWDTTPTLAEPSGYALGTAGYLKANDIYLLEVVSGRFAAPYPRGLILEPDHRHVALATRIENTGHGAAITLERRRLSDLCLITPRARYGKTARMMAHPPKFELEQVFLLR